MNSDGLSKIVQLGPNNIENNVEKTVGALTYRHERRTSVV